MPDPVQASLDPSLCALPDSVSLEENEAQMSLLSAHPLTCSAGAASAPSAPGTASAPESPAVSALVARFTAPSGAHPPVEPSLGHALLNCKVATAAYLANTLGAAVAAPESFGASFIFAALRIGASSAALASCIEQNEAQQVRDGERANQTADCRAAGAVPLTNADGSVVCAK